MEINFGIGTIVGLIVFSILLTFFLNKKYDIIKSWVSIIKKHPLFILIFFPAILTYFFVCGAISIFALYIYNLIVLTDYSESTFLLMENCVEFVCSFILPFLYFMFLKKHKFPVFWIFIITVVHAIVAGYRDAKFIRYSENDHESGPIILEHFEFFDAMFPLLALALFLVLNRKMFFPQNSTIVTS